jgi:NAD(P)-dependent dehydrogenase (short-subunit alcohol dehydrogenase family)
MTDNGSPTPWGLIVGSSSGFGAAVSLELARSGLNILGVHFDRRQNMPQVEQVIAKYSRNRPRGHLRTTSTPPTRVSAAKR